MPRLTLLHADITQLPVDAIVNAANSALAGGGGVDGAIHRAGGPAIMAELDALRPKAAPLPAGQAVATTAGRLPARFVFHTVGPVWRGGHQGEPEALASCYQVCLRLAEENAVKRISFPAISTGVYGYPFEQATAIAIREVRRHLAQPETIIEEVLLVYFSQTDLVQAEALL